MSPQLGLKFPDQHFLGFYDPINSFHIIEFSVIFLSLIKQIQRSHKKKPYQGGKRLHIRT